MLTTNEKSSAETDILNIHHGKNENKLQNTYYFREILIFTTGVSLHR